MMIYDNDFVGWMNGWLGIYNIQYRAFKGILNLKKNNFKLKVNFFEVDKDCQIDTI